MVLSAWSALQPRNQLCALQPGRTVGLAPAQEGVIQRARTLTEHALGRTVGGVVDGSGACKSCSGDRSQSDANSNHTPHRAQSVVHGLTCLKPSCARSCCTMSPLQHNPGGVRQSTVQRTLCATNTSCTPQNSLVHAALQVPLGQVFALLCGPRGVSEAGGVGSHGSLALPEVVQREHPFLRRRGRQAPGGGCRHVGVLKRVKAQASLTRWR